MAFLPISLASFVFRTEWVKGSRRFFLGLTNTWDLFIPVHWDSVSFGPAFFLLRGSDLMELRKRDGQLGLGESSCCCFAEGTYVIVVGMKIY
jgi:hypothetical protein